MSMGDIIVARVTAPHFVAGCRFNRLGVCVEASPMLGWFVGMGRKRVEWCVKKAGWHMTYRSADVTREELEAAVEASLSYADVTERLGHVRDGPWYKVIREMVLDYDMDTSHFDPHLELKGKLIG